jgi:hypothetical protein
MSIFAAGRFLFWSLLLSLGVVAHAWAQSCSPTFIWLDGGTNMQGTASALCSAHTNTSNSANGSNKQVYSPESGTNETPTSINDQGKCQDVQTLQCLDNPNNHCGSPNPPTVNTIHGAVNLTPIQQTTCQTCTAGQKMDMLDALAQSGNSGLCVNGCQYYNDANTLVIGPTAASSGAHQVGQAVNTGATCSTNTSGVTASSNQGGNNCFTLGGKSYCANDPTQQVCVAGDCWTPKQLPDASQTSGGGCIGTSAGGAACSSNATPPAPSTATSTTTAATPSAVETDGSGDTTYYYNSTVVGASKNPVVTSPGGSSSSGGSSSGGSSSGGSSSGGSSSGPDASNGDCGASGVDCTGDGVVPNLGPEDTIAVTTSNYYDALSSVPIVAAFSGLSSSMPAGSCPSFTFNAFGKSLVMNEQCDLMAQIQPILSLVMLAVWTIIGARIVMGA